MQYLIQLGPQVAGNINYSNAVEITLNVNQPVVGLA